MSINILHNVRSITIDFRVASVNKALKGKTIMSSLTEEKILDALRQR